MKAESGAVTRAWTAPYDGTVAISGQAAAGNDGATAEICVTKNGLAISGTEKTVNSMEGTAANYSDIQVSAGDVLRFEVSGDEVFWILPQHIRTAEIRRKMPT